MHSRAGGSASAMPVQEIKLKAASDAPSKSGLENVPPDQLERAMKAAMARNDTDLDLTEEEQNKFTKAFQDKEFRKMMAEYVDEISDPKHRAEQDAYIREMEAKGGTISASRGFAAPSRHRRASSPGEDVVAGFFFEFEAVRTEASDRDAPRRNAEGQARDPSECGFRRQDEEGGRC